MTAHARRDVAAPTADTHPTVSVVITTYKRRDGLAAVLEPVLADPATHEAVVVVDHCHDGSLELLQEHARRDPRVIPVWAEENLGQPRARSLGVERASGELVLSLDDDVVPRAGLVGGHARAHATEDGRVVLGYMPVLLPSPRRAADFALHNYAASYERHTEEYEADPAVILTKLWAGNFSVRRGDFLRAVVGRDLTIAYHEDRQLGWYFQQAGLVGAFDRRLAADHHYERDFAGWVRDGTRMGEATIDLHEAHGGRLGTMFDPDRALPSYSLPARVLMRAADRPRAKRGVLELLRGCLLVTGEVRLWGLQEKFAQIAHHVGERQGARAALARRPHVA